MAYLSGILALAAVWVFCAFLADRFRLNAALLPLPGLAGDTLWAIINNARYPATLLSGVTLRIRAEHEVTRGRAAILKAYYLKNTSPDVPEEVLRMSLNEQSTHIPYTLGRLFSVLEAIQQAANPGINTTIKDKYFNSAASIPGVIFPI